MSSVPVSTPGSRLRVAGDRAFRLVFGDRLGLLVFLGSLAFFGLTWRIDVFMTDSVTVVNGLGALTEGHLAVRDLVLGSSLDTPGMTWVGGEAMARNYGVIVPALPVYFLLRLVERVATLHVALVAAWHLVVLAFLGTLDRSVNRPRGVAVGGSAIVLLSFLGNLALARQLPDFAPYVASLQILTLLVAGLSAVVCYRLVASVHAHQLGGLAAGALAVGSPLAFWSAFPKRHVFTGFAVLVVLYAFHRSRSSQSRGVWYGVAASTWYRGLAYATVGLYAWIHAGEALFMFGALALVDLPTAPRHTIRSFAALAGIFALSLLPMTLTNLALSGEVLRPPRLLPDFEPDTLTASADGGEEGVFSGGGAGGSADGTGGSPSTHPAFDVVGRAMEVTVAGLRTLISDPAAVFRTYLRSTSRAARALQGGDGQLRYAAANLSVLESMPLAAGLVAGLAIVARALRGRLRDLRVGLSDLRGRLRDMRDAVTATDALAVVFALTFAVLYAQRLPLVAQYTQRYLFPLYPLTIYGLARLQPVRRCLAANRRLACWTYAGAVLIGGQLVLVAVVAQELAVSEAFQFHAMVHLATGALLALALSAAVVRPERTRPAAVALGLVTATGTVFVLWSAVVYFPIGRFALPAVEVLSDLIAAA